LGNSMMIKLGRLFFFSNCSSSLEFTRSIDIRTVGETR
jgi:hypothetical protein